VCSLGDRETRVIVEGLHVGPVQDAHTDADFLSVVKADADVPVGQADELRHILLGGGRWVEKV
jgi:hypothetical protein